MDNSFQPIIIKKVKKAGHAHHGGAWKIAYADFVTAMMAFFLLLWLISMTTPEQKEGLANYFAPPNVSESNSGSGGVMGGTSLGEDGAQMAGSANSTQKDVSIAQQNTDQGLENAAMGGQGGQGGSVNDAVKESQTDLRSQSDQVFHAAAASIKQAWQAMPEVAQVADNLLVEQTQNGLNIKIMDQEGRPMFPEGSKYPLEVTRQAIAAIAPILEKLPNQINISGHSSAGGTYANPRYGAWELTADRANVVRSILGEFGLAQDHVSAVIGRASGEPLFPNDPYQAANERIEITVLYAAPPVPSDMSP